MLRDMFRLWRVARRRKDSESRYREFQSFQATLLIRYLEAHGIALEGRRLLDLGSGFGGYDREFAARGARVIALDLDHSRDTAPGIRRLTADAMAVPVRSASVDVVFCASLVEHVRDPARVLAEIARVMRPGGFAYVSFPPYYSPLGGHEFSPFHYFGERFALRMRRRRHLPAWVAEIHPVREDAAGFGDLFEGWGLYRMTIGGFLRLLRKSPLVCRDMSARHLPISFVRWPGIREVLTWHVQFLLERAGRMQP
jgi:SAM-dependent methyltransferase